MTGLDWMDRAQCLNVADPEIFFTTRAEDPSEAEAICGRCPVRLACRELMQGDASLVGTWGGITRPVPGAPQNRCLRGLEEKRARVTAEAQRRLATGMKTCSSCEEELPFDQFHRQSRSPDGRKGQCIACSRAALRRRLAVAA